jgi:hypothetical protein
MALLIKNNIAKRPIALINEQLDKLTSAQRDAFFALSHASVHLPADLSAKKRAKRLPLAIFETNAVSAGDRAGLFPRMARLNHGCSSAFNVVYSWRESEGVLVVHALKPIKKGEVRVDLYMIISI